MFSGFFTKLNKLLIFITVAGLISVLQIPEGRSATFEYEYDDLGRLITVTLSNGDTYDITYDDAGNRLTWDKDNISSSWPVEFMVDGGAAYEDAQITFTVTRFGTGGTKSVDYDTFGDSAIEGTDYTGASGTLTFLSADTEKTVTVSTTSDSDAEGVEVFFLDLSNPTGGSDVVISRASGLIIDGSQPNSPPVAKTFNIFLAISEDLDVCVTCNADPDGDEATVKSISSTGGIIATITTDDKKVNVWGVQGAQGTVTYTLEDPSGAEDTGVINVEVEEGGQ